MKKKVLIVDDEKDVLRIVGKRLSYAGYDVITAESGSEALIKAQKEKPGLIILDVLMPGMDGAETANALKRNVATKDIPVIFLTCLLTKGEEKNRRVIGGKYFISKPYDPKELIKAVSGYLDR